MITGPIYTWDADNGIATVEQTIDNKHIKGTAKVAEEDKQFANKYTGLTIAELRMNLDYAKQHIEYDLKPQLFILNHLLGTMKKSPRFNPESYEAKRIFAERQNIIDDIEQFKNWSQATRDYLKEYIEHKDLFYRMVEKGENN